MSLKTKVLILAAGGVALIVAVGLGFLIGYQIGSASRGTEFASYSDGYDAGYAEAKKDLIETGRIPATETKAGKIDILSHSSSINQIGTYQIDGEVQNNTGSKATYVKVTATFYDANKKVIDTAFSFADPKNLEAGQKAPFKIYNTKPEVSGGIASYDLAASQ